MITHYYRYVWKTEDLRSSTVLLIIVLISQDSDLYTEDVIPVFLLSIVIGVYCNQIPFISRYR